MHNSDYYRKLLLLFIVGIGISFIIYIGTIPSFIYNIIELIKPIVNLRDIDKYVDIFTIVLITIVILSIILNYNPYKESIKIVKEVQKVSSKIDKIAEYEKPSELLNKKNNIFLEIPVIDFYYYDKEKLKNFYDDYFSDPVIESIAAKTINEASDDTQANIPQILESKIGAKQLTELVSKVRLPKPSVSSMFRRYQNELISKGQVHIGLEEVEVERSELDSFDTILEKIRSNYNLIISDESIDNQRKLLKEKAVEKTLVKLESASGYILIEGNFTIEDDEEYYKFIYPHPVNEYITENKIHISFMLKKNLLSESISANFPRIIRRAMPINLKIFASVLSPVKRDMNSYEFMITPFAIYQ